MISTSRAKNLLDRLRDWSLGCRLARSVGWAVDQRAPAIAGEK